MWYGQAQPEGLPPEMKVTLAKGEVCAVALDNTTSTWEGWIRATSSYPTTVFATALSSGGGGAFFTS